MDTNVTGYVKTNPLVYAIEVDTPSSGRVDSGDNTTWYFRVNGGAWTQLTTATSPAKLILSPALVNGTSVASANRLVNTACGSFQPGLKEFESTNPQGNGSEFRDGECSETQASIDLSAANPGDDFEFKITQVDHDGATVNLIGLAHVIILVPNVSYVTASAQSGSVTINWSSSYTVLIARKAGSAVTDTPVNGTTYVAGNAMGASTVAYSGSVVETSFADTGLTNGTTYYYKVFAKTATPVYASGSAINAAPTSGSSGSPTWSYATTATSMAPPGLDPWSNSVVLGSNDNNVHGMADSNGTLAFAPFATSGAIQQRPAMLPAFYRTPAGSGVNITYVTSQDGFAYAVDTSTGLQVWKSPSLAASSMLQGGPGVWIQKLKSLSICGVTTSDVVFVGTRDTGTTSANKVYALNGSGGSVTSSGGGNCAAAGPVLKGEILWTYAGSGISPCSTCMDIISSTPYVDYTNNVVWVTSRAAGNGTVQPSVWKLNASNGTLAGGTATWIFNDVDSTPVPSADGAFIYVGTNAGTLKAIKVSDGTVVTHTPASTAPCNCTGAGAIQGMPWPLSYVPVGVATPDTIIFSRNATVHSVNFNGSTFSANWTTTPTGTPATVSAPVDDGANHIYIGGSDGKVHQLDVAAGTDQLQAPTTAISGTFGDPTFNWDITKIHVGSTDGHTYTFTTPF